jgi:hypothetical protein
VGCWALLPCWVGSSCISHAQLEKQLGYANRSLASRPTCMHAWAPYITTKTLGQQGQHQKSILHWTALHGDRCLVECFCYCGQVLLHHTRHALTHSHMHVTPPLQVHVTHPDRNDTSRMTHPLRFLVPAGSLRNSSSRLPPKTGLQCKF